MHRAFKSQNSLYGPFIVVYRFGRGGGPLLQKSTDGGVELEPLVVV